MQKSKTIKIFALIGIALFVVFGVIPPFTRKWARNHFIRYSSIIPTNNWKKFSSAEGKFSVWFPGNPEYTNFTESVSGLDIPASSFFIWNRQMEFAVNYVDYPKFLEKLTPERKYDICQTAISKELGKIVYSKDVTFGKYQARDLEYDVTGMVNYSGRIRLILVNDRIYQSIVIFSTGYPHPPDRDTFFNSLQLQN